MPPEPGQHSLSVIGAAIVDHDVPGDSARAAGGIRSNSLSIVPPALYAGTRMNTLRITGLRAVAGGVKETAFGARPEPPGRYQLAGWQL